MLLNTHNGSVRKSKGNFKHTLRQMTEKTQSVKIYGMLQKLFSEGSSQQYSPSSKKKKIIFYLLKALEKEEQTKKKVLKRKEIINIREEIKTIEIQKTTAKIKRTNSGSLKG